MTDFKTITAASGAGVTLSLSGFLRNLKLERRLRPLLTNALLQEMLVQQARQKGLSVSTEELQASADAFRQTHQLHRVQQARAWLERERLSEDDFEAALERELLIAKLRDDLIRPRIEEHFVTHRDQYDWARLHLILVPREDLARELLTQLREEGQDFADLAQRHSLHSSRQRGGALGTLMRRHLTPAVAEAVFAARPQQVVGPLASPEGFQLLLVADLHPAELDGLTRAAIGQELFDRWVAEQFRQAPLALPLLDTL